MKFFTLASILCAASVALAAPASTAASGKATVSYDQAYDKASSSLTAVACSDGAHGLMTKGKLVSIFELDLPLMTVLRLQDDWRPPRLPSGRRCLRRWWLELRRVRHLLEAHVQEQEHQHPCH